MCAVPEDTKTLLDLLTLELLVGGCETPDMVLGRELGSSGGVE